MKKLFAWMIDKWLAGFLTATIFFLLKLYLDLPEESKQNFFSFVWIGDLLQTPISLSKVLIIFIIIIVLTRIERAFVKAKFQRQDDAYLKTPESHFENYKRDVFGVNGTTWTWKYNWNIYKQSFEIADLKPLCKKCWTEMEVGNSFSSEYRCRLENRHYHFTLSERMDDVEKEIVRRIKNDEFGKHA